MVWLFIGIISLAALGLLVWPIFSRSRVSEHQIDETDYLAAEAAAAHEGENDIDARRRLLAASRAKEKKTPAAPVESVSNRRGLAIVLIGAVPVTAVALYLALGRPDYWQAEQIAAAPAAIDSAQAIAQLPEAERTAMIENMVEGLAARLADNPKDADGWAMLSRSYAVLGRMEESVAAIKTALTHFPDDPDFRLAYAQGLVALKGGLEAGGEGTPANEEIAAAFEAVLELNADQPLALFVLGENARLSGDPDAAKTYWSRLLEAMPADTPESAQLSAMIEALN